MWITQSRSPYIMVLLENSERQLTLAAVAVRAAFLVVVAVSFILSMSEVGLVISSGILKKVWISDSQKSWFSICIWVIARSLCFIDSTEKRRSCLIRFIQSYLYLA